MAENDGVGGEGEEGWQAGVRNDGVGGTGRSG